jgi:Ca-activated chloride channel family protein
VKKAKENQIPIYVIGLGDVNRDTLSLIAKQTNGRFYYTKSSSDLNTIYNLISRQVQAFYSLTYTSPNFSSADSIRSINLSFDIDSLFTNSDSTTLHLPKEVIAYIKIKERQMAVEAENNRKQREYFAIGGSFVAILAGTGSLIFYRRRRR